MARKGRFGRIDEGRPVAKDAIRALTLNGLVDNFLVDVVNYLLVGAKVNHAVREERLHIADAGGLKGGLHRPWSPVERDVEV